jgi:hypothetical protein
MILYVQEQNILELIIQHYLIKKDKLLKGTYLVTKITDFNKGNFHHW